MPQSKINTILASFFFDFTSTGDAVDDVIREMCNACATGKENCDSPTCPFSLTPTTSQNCAAEEVI